MSSIFNLPTCHSYSSTDKLAEIKSVVWRFSFVPNSVMCRCCAGHCWYVSGTPTDQLKAHTSITFSRFFILPVSSKHKLWFPDSTPTRPAAWWSAACDQYTKLRRKLRGNLHQVHIFHCLRYITHPARQRSIFKAKYCLLGPMAIRYRNISNA